MNFPRHIKAFRWLVYLAALLMMVVHEVCLGVRTGFELWCVMVEQNEAGWRRRMTSAQKEYIQRAEAENVRQRATELLRTTERQWSDRQLVSYINDSTSRATR